MTCQAPLASDPRENCAWQHAPLCPRHYGELLAKQLQRDVPFGMLATVAAYALGRISVERLGVVAVTDA